MASPVGLDRLPGDQVTAYKDTQGRYHGWFRMYWNRVEHFKNVCATRGVAVVAGADPTNGGITQRVAGGPNRSKRTYR